MVSIDIHIVIFVTVGVTEAILLCTSHCVGFITEVVGWVRSIIHEGLARYGCVASGFRFCKLVH